MTAEDMTARDILRALDGLLEKERLALLEGRLETLVALLPEKERLIEALAALDAGAAEAEITALRGKAARNQHLMDSTMRGIRSVATRLGTLRRLRRSLETYDESGRRTTIVTEAGNRMEKRA